MLCGALAALLLTLIAVLLRMARGRGEIQVSLSYPHEFRGTFSVRLSQRKTGSRAPRIKNADEAARQGASTRTEHHMVARTSFRGVLPGTWYVVAEGFVQAGEGNDLNRRALRGARDAGRADQVAASTSTSSRARARSRCRHLGPRR